MCQLVHFMLLGLSARGGRRLTLLMEKQISSWVAPDAFALCIPSIGPYVRENNVKSFLTEGGVKFCSVYKENMSAACFVSFVSKADLDAAMASIPSLKFKNKSLVVKPTTTASWQSLRDRRIKQDARRLNLQAAPAASVSSDDALKSVHEALTPWQDIPYADQLNRKDVELRRALRTISLRLRQHILGMKKLLTSGEIASREGARSGTAGHKRKGDSSAGAQGTSGDAAAAAALPIVAGTNTTAPAVTGDSAVTAAAAASSSTGDGTSEAVAAAAASGDDAAAAAAASKPQVDAAASSSSSCESPRAASPARPSLEPFAADAVVDLTAHLTPDIAERLPAWLRTQPPLHGGMACSFLGVVPSPRLYAYRNKGSYTIGLDTAGQPCAGQRISSYAEGCTVVVPEGSRSNPPEMLRVVHRVNEFLRSSPLPVYNMDVHSGVWRGLTVRWAETTGQCMVILLAKRPSVIAGGVAAAGPSAAAAASSSSARTDSLAAASGSPDLAALYDSELRRFMELMMCPSFIHGGVSRSGEEAQREGRASTSVESSSAAPAAAPASAPAAAASAAPSAAAGESPSSLMSLYVQDYQGLSVPLPNDPFVLLAGAPVIVEHMCGLQFEISPGAFFQVNTASAERLYAAARALAVSGEAGVDQLRTMLPATVVTGSSSSSSFSTSSVESAPAVSSSGSRSSTLPDLHSTGTATASTATTTTPATGGGGGITLLDVCCGTGTIGLVSARHVSRVIGLELSADAVADAVRNAARNGVENASFICGDMRVSMKQVVEAARAHQPVAAAAVAAAIDADSSVAPASEASNSVVAIVDPPRGGLHPDVIRALRTCRGLDRVVYVSCNPTGSLVEDAVKLCAPQDENNRALRGPAFQPLCALSVDMFPHTQHSEMVMLFER